MKNLTDKVHDTDWDTLVILDSFRYDYFIDEYQHFPYVRNGDVEKVISPGSATPEVAPKLFPGTYDYNLYSANKVVYAEGIIDNWHPTETFNKVIEIESSTHNETQFTPSPQDEIEFVKDNKKKINKHKSVLWMMQPHTPYFGDVQLNFPPNRMDSDKLRDEDNNMSEVFKYLLRESYRGNVRQALWIATAVLGMLDGNIVITSDHGELLFDETIRDGNVESGHYSGSTHSKLRNVPWVKINATEHEDIHEIDAEKFVKLAFDCVLGREVDAEAKTDLLETIRAHESGEITDKLPYCRKDLIPILLRSDEYERNLLTSSNSKPKIPAKQLKELGYL